MQMNMEYWKRFESSGKIEDYLTFVSDKAGGAGGGQRTPGEALHAGIYHSDGNGTKAVSRGGVRQAYQHFD